MTRELPLKIKIFQYIDCKLGKFYRQYLCIQTHFSQGVYFFLNVCCQCMKCYALNSWTVLETCEKWRSMILHHGSMQTKQMISCNEFALPFVWSPFTKRTQKIPVIRLLMSVEDSETSFEVFLSWWINHAYKWCHLTYLQTTLTCVRENPS